MATSTDFLKAELTNRSSGNRGWRAGLQRFWSRIEQWQQRAEQRKALLALDDRILKDIGITRADVVREAEKPFWKP